MNVTRKLTKKQKKALAFRERKPGKSKVKGNDDTVDIEDDDNAVPIMEIQDGTGLEDDDIPRQRLGRKVSESSREKGASKGKGKQDPGLEEDSTGNDKKRKRETEEVDGEKPPTRRQKHKKPDAESSENAGVANAQEKVAKQRFILFLGNLKYSTSREAIEQHFSACGPPPTVRLLTPKASSISAKIVKSKGCAFLEFTERHSLQQALKLHQSMLHGRMINVELTAGGGGKSTTRLNKLKLRNKALLGQRLKHLEKEETDSGSIPTLPSRPQRFSSTSGVESTSMKKRTWAVDNVDDRKTHRGGVKHAKSRKSGNGRARNWGTGVNAIPVG